MLMMGLWERPGGPGGGSLSPSPPPTFPPRRPTRRPPEHPPAPLPVPVGACVVGLYEFTSVGEPFPTPPSMLQFEIVVPCTSAGRFRQTSCANMRHSKTVQNRAVVLLVHLQAQRTSRNTASMLSHEHSRDPRSDRPCHLVPLAGLKA